MRRLALVAVIAALVAAVAVAGRGDAASDATIFAGSAEIGTAMPSADPEGALGSTWYCAAGTAAPDGVADLTVHVANPTATVRVGTVTWVAGGGGERVAQAFEVGATATVALRALDAVTSVTVSAVVEVDGGGVVVEHAVEGALGADVAPCASSAAERWHLAAGSTERGAAQALAVFNPFPDDAVVDIGLATDQGRDEPPALQALPIPGGTTVLVDVGDGGTRRRAVTSATVAARTGRVVVDRLQTFDGALGRRGLDLALATPAPALEWVFPDGRTGEGVSQRFHVYNPGDAEAIVVLEVVPDEGGGPVPVERAVAPQGRLTLDTVEAGVTAGVAHRATVRSVNGVAVVAERELDAREPSLARGWSSELGSPGSAPRWALAAGMVGEGVDERVAVANGGTTPLTVTVSRLDAGRLEPVDGLESVELAPAGRIDLSLDERIEGEASVSLVVEADGPIVVGRGLYRREGRGVSTSIGVVLP